MGDKLGMPLGNAPDCCTAPVVAADDHFVHVHLRGDACYGVGVGFESIVADVGGEALVMRQLALVGSPCWWRKGGGGTVSLYPIESNAMHLNPNSMSMGI